MPMQQRVVKHHLDRSAGPSRTLQLTIPTSCRSMLIQSEKWVSLLMSVVSKPKDWNVRALEGLVPTCGTIGHDCEH